MGVETILSASRLTATPAMTDDSQLSFNLPSVSRKKVAAAFDGGRLSSDSGVMLLALADRRRRVADTLAALIADPRDRSHITHTVADVLRARMLAISCGYPGWQRLRSATVRSGLQTCLRSVARQRVGPLLATNYLALGECTIAARDHLPHLCAGRYLVPESPEAAPVRDAGYR
jgi:hypothetical protein